MVRRRDLLRRPPVVPVALHHQRIRSAGRLHETTTARHVRHGAASQESLRRDISRNICVAATSLNPADGLGFRERHLEDSPRGLSNLGVEGVRRPLLAGDLEAHPGVRPSSRLWK